MSEVHKDAGEIALDEIAALCGVPDWEYPGQVVRDVRMVVAERDRLRQERDHYREIALSHGGKHAPSDAPDTSTHAVGERTCVVGDCRYKGHNADLLPMCLCGGVRHVVATDWSEYSFGHAGGHVGFTWQCDQCGGTS